MPQNELFCGTFLAEGYTPAKHTVNVQEFLALSQSCSVQSSFKEFSQKELTKKKGFEAKEYLQTVSLNKCTVFNLGLLSYSILICINICRKYTKCNT